MDFTEEQIERYSRHILLPDVGGVGQKKIRNTSVLIVGAGGLGSPSAFYLTAAGIGRLGLLDYDNVELSNLQRQILHNTSDIGVDKVHSAGIKLRALNPDVEIVEIRERINSDSAFRILEGFDIVLDGSDNFPTRYLINDACVLKRKPISSGSIFRFEGQVTTIIPGVSPCYRCLYPEPPPPGMVPSCQEAGVLGVVAGTIGIIQATEVLKWILGKGNLLTGKLLLYDALNMSFRTMKIPKNPSCAICGENPTIKELIDYEEFCGEM